jgi:predicted dehydrogenase
MPSQSPDAEVLIAGAGPMAEEHVRALLAAGVAPEAVLVVARGPDRTELLAGTYGVSSAFGGVESLTRVPKVAVVAVTDTELAPVMHHLVAHGAEAVLVEKPGALFPHELDGLDGHTIFVAYNRRFYASVARARELISADGGVLSVAFDFTEIEARVLEDAARRGLDDAVLGRWGIANSLHVVDLAFHLAGDPVHLDAHRSGALPWHPAGAVFAGAGELAGGGLFSYLATWSGAGRWGIELTTRERKLVLRPLESLHEQRRGSFAVEPVPLGAEGDGLKPGLLEQARAFLAAARGGAVDENLCTLADARARLVLAERIFGYA